jgi:hypothetical protein
MESIDKGLLESVLGPGTYYLYVQMYGSGLALKYQLSLSKK